jgi:ring-1,2-phenylacetyl-CoA epoxidase subunit PaaE
MKRFHRLTVERVTAETDDSVRIAFAVPESAADDFDFLPGQHLPFQFTIGGRKLRRTYSICSARGERPIEIGVRVLPDGRFSEFAAHRLAAGDTVEAMPPAGQFHVDPGGRRAGRYLAFAAGSGITPILSMLKSVLAAEPDSRFVLFYGNRTLASTMFVEDLYALKNRFPDRLLLHFVFSREEQEFAIANGRLDGDKVRELLHGFCAGIEFDGVFVCGPGTMIADVVEALTGLGYAEDRVHTERFGAPKTGVREAAAPAAAHATVTLIMDGHEKRFEMHPDDDNIVDAAAARGIDLPFSCKGGVCATCRCHLREGEVAMATNFALEPWEIEAGYVLACQSRPVSSTILLDYDKT